MKYNPTKIYKGNLLKNINGQSISYKDKALLIYDENKDVFYDFLKTFNLFLSRDLEKLSKEELKESKKIISEHTYSYINNGIDGEVYVDETSIEVLLNNEGKKR